MKTVPARTLSSIVRRLSRPTVGVLGIALAFSMLSAFADSPPDDRRNSAKPPSAGLKKFHHQKVKFGPCAPYASSAIDEQLYANKRFDCARIKVPLDYSRPNGEQGEVAILRAKARGKKVGSLLVNPGGPGGSGMNFVALLGPIWNNISVGERFDVIGFDPRGVGASTPRVDCYTDAEYDSGLAKGMGVFDVPDAQTAIEVASHCTEGTGGADLLTSVGSINVVQDMDIMRAALKDKKLSYLGYSYGSELGGMYAEAFPKRLRALVIDGAVDPELTETEFRVSQFAGFQKAFDGMATLCAADASCPLGTDPAQATREFQNLIRPLLDHPLPTAGGRELAHQDVLKGVTSSLLTESQWPLIIEGLAEAKAGRGEALLAMRDASVGRGADGKYGGLNHAEAGLATRCMDNPQRNPDEQSELVRKFYEAAPFADPGRPVTEAHYECEAWPEPPNRTSPWMTGDVDVPPTLTVSITGDPGTPHQGGINMARLLGGNLLTVVGEQHGVALYGGSACVDKIVSDYLIDLKTPPDDARCTI